MYYFSIRNFCYCLFIGLLINCGGGSGPATPESPIPITDPAPKTEPTTQVDTEAERIEKLRVKVSEFVSQQLEKLSDLNCHDNPSADACRLEDVFFSQGEFVEEKSSPEQVVLVIDDEGVEAPSILRYRSRVQTMFKQDETGFFRAYDASVKLPHYIVNITQSLDRFQDDRGEEVFIPSAWVGSNLDFIKKVNELMPSGASNSSAAHGDMPFLYLANHNPKARFLTAHLPDFYEVFSEDFCSLKVSSLTEKIKLVSNSFKEDVIESYGVSYINLSAGWTLNTVKNSWKKMCEDNDKVKNVDGLVPEPTEEDYRLLLATVKPFYEVLFNTSGVAGFQAVVSNGEDKLNFALDLDDSYQNRIRVGVFSSLNSNLKGNGFFSEDKIPNFPSGYFLSRHSVEIIINTGVTKTVPLTFNNMPLMDSDEFGISYFPALSSAPSWTTPVALSYAIYLKNSELSQEIMSDSLIQQLKSLMAPIGCKYSGSDQEERCIMQDPLLYGHSEVYRMGLIDKGEVEVLLNKIRDFIKEG